MTTGRGTTVTGVAGTGVPVRGDDIDTDRILPARFLKEVTFENMGEYAFYDRRFDAEGEPTDHPFNEFEGASILVVNDNFGCGSSREHAPQALMRWGIDGIIGESFAEIFRDNCESLGVPTVTAPREAVVELQDWVAANPRWPDRTRRRGAGGPLRRPNARRRDEPLDPRGAFGGHLGHDRTTVLEPRGRPPDRQSLLDIEP